MSERNDNYRDREPDQPSHPDRPTGPTVYRGTLHRVRTGRGVTLTQRPPREPVRYPARIAIQLALSLKLQQMIDAGEIRDRAEIARRLGVTRARVTQMMRLTLLPIAEQERILFLEAVDGREPALAAEIPRTCLAHLAEAASLDVQCGDEANSLTHAPIRATIPLGVGRSRPARRCGKDAPSASGQKEPRSHAVVRTPDERHVDPLMRQTHFLAKADGRGQAMSQGSLSEV